MSKPITWTNDQIRLGDLKAWEHNPRYSTEKQAERITDSHRMFGQVDLIAIDAVNSVLNGHQRLSVWLAEYGADYVVDVRRCSRELEDDERQALTTLLHVGAVGSFNWDILSGWDADILQGFGFDEDLLKGWQKDTFALGDLLASGELIFRGDTNYKSGSSPWERIGEAMDGVLFKFGEIETKLPQNVYIDFLARIPETNILQFICNILAK